MRWRIANNKYGFSGETEFPTRVIQLLWYRNWPRSMIFHREITQESPKPSFVSFKRLDLSRPTEYDERGIGAKPPAF
jgi:hypothetical protein